MLISAAFASRSCGENAPTSTWIFTAAMANGCYTALRSIYRSDVHVVSTVQDGRNRSAAGRQVPASSAAIPWSLHIEESRQLQDGDAMDAVITEGAAEQSAAGGSQRKRSAKGKAERWRGMDAANRFYFCCRMTAKKGRFTAKLKPVADAGVNVSEVARDL